MFKNENVEENGAMIDIILIEICQRYVRLNTNAILL